MPLAMAFRDKPQARWTIDTPPAAKPIASLAARMRLVRSSRTGQTGLNFCTSPAIELMHHDHIRSLPWMLPLFITDALSRDNAPAAPPGGPLSLRGGGAGI